jgi:hypothetical protein
MSSKNTEPSVKPAVEGFFRNTLRSLRSGENPVHVAAAAAGFVIATGVALASGQSATSEVTVAWASPLYFIFAWPLMCLVIYVMARAYPVRAWRWTLSMMLGQVFSSIFFGAGPMMPVAILFVTLLSVPQFYVGSLGSKAGLKRIEQSNSSH